MCRIFRYRGICLVIIISICLNSIAVAADMTITNLLPANNAAGICADTKLWITFATTPIIATSGNIQICKVSDDSVVWQLNLQTLSSPPSNDANWPYKYTSGSLTFNYQPFAVSGNTLEIFPYPQLGLFQYNTEYYVKMTAGFCSDSSANTSPAITDNTTWRFKIKAVAPTQDNDFTISPDGTGEFCTIQAAMNSIADANVRTIIRLKNGTYRELLHILKNNITLLGQNKTQTIIAAFNNNTFNPGSDLRRMIGITAGGFRMYNLSLRNTTPDGGTQAETIKNSGEKCIAGNCNFYSYQDTLLINGQMYFKDCYIEGDTDYIWGTGTTYFDKCQMQSLTTGGYVFQPRTPDGVKGLVAVDCNFTAPRGIRNCYLGRMFEPYGYAQVVMLNCIMPGTLFYPIGWLQNTLEDTSNLRLWEYKSVDQLGNLINISSRLTPGSRQLSDAEAIMWRDANYVFSANPWNPKIPDLPSTAWLPQPANTAADVNAAGTTLTWAPGAAATSHVVYFGTTNPPALATEQTSTSFATGTMIAGTTYYWQIDEKNSTGTTTGTVWSFTAAGYHCSDPIVADIGGNCQVDFFDYARLADAWAGNEPMIDLNDDGLLNLEDVSEFAMDWLTCNRVPVDECW
jgi:hypothetical protein